MGSRIFLGLTGLLFLAVGVATLIPIFTDEGELLRLLTTPGEYEVQFVGSDRLVSVNKKVIAALIIAMPTFGFGVGFWLCRQALRSAKRDEHRE